MSQNVALREIMTMVRRKEGTRDSRIHERSRGFFLFSFADNRSWCPFLVFQLYFKLFKKIIYNISYIYIYKSIFYSCTRGKKLKFVPLLFFTSLFLQICPKANNNGINLELFSVNVNPINSREKRAFEANL